MSFALGSIPLAFMIYYRVFRLRESSVWHKVAKKDRSANFKLLIKHFWHRCFPLTTSLI